jgi:hypothetical protein
MTTPTTQALTINGKHFDGNLTLIGGKEYLFLS